MERGALEFRHPDAVLYVLWVFKFIVTNSAKGGDDDDDDDENNKW